jgi:hypothetical protein
VGWEEREGSGSDGRDCEPNGTATEHPIYIFIAHCRQCRSRAPPRVVLAPPRVALALLGCLSHAPPWVSRASPQVLNAPPRVDLARLLRFVC